MSQAVGAGVQPVSEMRREVTAMVVYVAVILLATIAAVPAEDLGSRREVIGLIWGAAVGLSASHYFAFRLAEPLYSGGGMDREDFAIGAAQVGAAFVIAAIASVPLLFDIDEEAAAESVLALTIVLTLVAYDGSRRAGSRRLAAVVRAVLTLAVGVAVVAVKVAVQH